MNGELLAILEHIERDKGIKREIIAAAVEAALISAAKKSLGDREAEVTVKFDQKTGDIKIFSKDKELISEEFGRIAAQTAKQIIIQKLREAERDVIYDEYSAKIGAITHGAVHRFERGDIIVDLGKTEALLPKREQPQKEQYRQGDRVRALILDVKKTGRGPQIILSRTHADFVKKLFELEVPEIYEGIVEIKAVAREASERTKIAVHTNDAKIDSVGACVGMRGTRVKNIVRELHGEKIDIIHWSADIKDFITAALSPAKVAGITVEKENKKAQVVVEDDQLSLAIGKKGQNVRLAAKLAGYDIDIRSQSMLLPALAITEIKGVGPKTKKVLEKAGFKTAQSIAKATIEELAAAEGVGKKTAEKLIENAKAFLDKKSKEKE